MYQPHVAGPYVVDWCLWDCDRDQLNSPGFVPELGSVDEERLTIGVKEKTET